MVDLAAERSAGLSDRSEALHECIKQLPENSREFLRIRYAQQQTVGQIAEKTGRSIGAVKNVYYRIRVSLARCIDRKLAAISR